MSDGQDAGTTGAIDESVIEAALDALKTAADPSVSAETRPAATQPTPKADDPARRIANLMSQLDKTRNNLAEAVKRANEIQRLRESEKKDLSTKLEELVQATEQSTESLTKLTDENANLKKRLGKEGFLRKNPDLVDFDDIIPETDDESVLAKYADTLRRSKGEAKQQAKAEIKAGYVPPANPGRPSSAPVTSQEISDYLSAVRDDPAEWQRRSREVLEKLSAANSRG